MSEQYEKPAQEAADTTVAASHLLAETTMHGYSDELGATYDRGRAELALSPGFNNPHLGRRDVAATVSVQNGRELGGDGKLSGGKRSEYEAGVLNYTDLESGNHIENNALDGVRVSRRVNGEHVSRTYTGDGGNRLGAAILRRTVDVVGPDIEARAILKSERLQAAKGRYKRARINTSGQ